MTGDSGGSAMTGGSGGSAMTGGSGGTSTPPTSAFVYVSGNETSDMSIRLYQLNLTTGALTANGGVASGLSPAYGALHPKGTDAYFMSETWENGEHPLMAPPCRPRVIPPT